MNSTEPAHGPQQPATVPSPTSTTGSSGGSNPRRPRATSETHGQSHTTDGIDSQSSEPRPKRRKVATACDECRQRKSRCDGAKPCGPCTRKGRSPEKCVYQNDPNRPAVSQSYIEELEARIRSLEGNAGHAQPNVSVMEAYNGDMATTDTENHSLSYHRYDTMPHPIPPQLNQQQPPRNYTLGADMGLNRMDTGPLPSASIPQPGSHLLYSGTPEGAEFAPAHSKELDVTVEEPRERRFSVTAGLPPKARADAMGATSSSGGDGVDGDENESFFGSSSAVSFMKQIKQTVDKKKTCSKSPEELSFCTPAPGFESAWERKPRNDDGFLEDLEDFILPPRRIADHLLECYWTWVDSLYPYLHRPTFMQTYNQLWTNSAFPGSNDDALFGSYESKPPGRLFRCILNCVFAFGCQFSSNIAPARRDSSADVFFKRSRLLLHVDILGCGSIQLVQALLLMGQFLQSTKYPNRCWNVAGLAIRVAQGLGLHLDSTSAKRKNNVEREIWRRAWHGCILLDRIVSMTFGRPSMVSLRSQVTLPMAIDDEYLTNDNAYCEQPEGVYARTTFFIHTLKLYEILGEILSIFYDTSGSRNEKPRPDDYYQSLLRLDRMLLDFQLELPAALRLHFVDPEAEPIIRDSCQTRQANVLHARYLNIRILLFRPILINLVQDSQAYHDQKSKRLHPTSLLEASLAMKCSVSCVEAAQEAISLIDDNLLSGAVPAWWYYIFYLYTAATVLLAAKLCPALETELDYDSLEVSWKKCIAILRSLEDGYESAKRCLATLEVFHDQIISASDEGQQDAGEQADGEAEIPCEGGGDTPDDPLLLFNSNRGAVWGADVNFDWFMEHPLWNTPDQIP